MLGFLNKKPRAVRPQNEDVFRKGFAGHIPEDAVDYVMALWREHPFNFTVAGSRKTCLGNYMYKNGRHFISVNGDSNPYSFLITLIHEIAHQRVRVGQKLFHRAPAPHGQEWKFHFKTLMAPLLSARIFPEDILQVLVPHMQNPAASSTKDPALVRALSFYSPEKVVKGIYLSEVPDGKVFNFNGRQFKRIQPRRTRILVECVNTRKRYTIPGVARVEL
ncbi:transcription elongation protein SprT [Leadbetterella sp. DM7]|uniref:transcription elongation protein SprT n=1 Tax=Leadbetterella sp. DM7 TaxID=3235085 RepID=UPI00349E793F